MLSFMVFKIAVKVTTLIILMKDLKDCLLILMTK